MFSALKPKLFVKSHIIVVTEMEKTTNCRNKHLTTFESTFKFLLAMSPATDPSTTVFSFFIVQLFLQLQGSN